MVSNINDIIKDYISQTEYDIVNSLGNCSFFTKDFINWAKNNGIKADYIYMPQSEEYRKENNITDDKWEDHIAPMLNNVIIDFTYTPQGVSKDVRNSNTIPPMLFKYNKSLFEPNGVYGKYGYTNPEINTVYGNEKNINSFNVTEPNKKKSEKIEKLIKLAHDDITRKKGKEYAPDVHEIRAWINDYLKGGEKIDEAKKTDFSKEKSQGLHGWFVRQGGSGKSKGWVDCNTCRKDPETGRKKCKSCGRQDGEKRKYPACRPTPSACGTRGKGKKWGKKSHNESENKNTMKDLIAQKLHEMVEENHNEFQNYMFFNNLKTIHDAITELMQMDPQQVDQILSDGHNWATDHLATSADDIEEVYHFLNATLGEHEPDSYDGETEPGYEDEHGSVEDGMAMMNEAEYKGRKVQLGKPTRGDVKKYKVFVKNAKGKVVKVNFGDKNMEIKRDNPKRRKSFRARHKCAQAKDRTTPKYWSCRMWSKKPVSKIVGENFGFDENTSIFVKKNEMTQPATKPLVPETKPRTTEPKKPVQPSRKNKPFLPEVTPGIKTDPKATDLNK